VSARAECIHTHTLRFLRIALDLMKRSRVERTRAGLAAMGLSGSSTLVTRASSLLGIALGSRMPDRIHVVVLLLYPPHATSDTGLRLPNSASQP
jgi:hypothetical protein